MVASDNTLRQYLVMQVERYPQVKVAFPPIVELSHVDTSGSRGKNIERKNPPLPEEWCNFYARVVSRRCASLVQCYLPQVHVRRVANAVIQHFQPQFFHLQAALKFDPRLLHPVAGSGVLGISSGRPISERRRYCDRDRLSAQAKRNTPN